MRDTCKCCLGEDLGAVFVGSEKRNTEIQNTESKVKKKIHSFLQKENIKNCSHKLHEEGSCEQRDWRREEGLIFILYLFCFNAQLDITVILKMKAVVLWEIVDHFVHWFSTSLR